MKKQTTEETREQELKDEVESCVGFMALVIQSLSRFKLECYAQANKGITMDWLMKHAPCNIDASGIMCDVLKRYFPEIYQERGKSINQMEEELKQKIKEMKNE